MPRRRGSANLTSYYRRIGKIFEGIINNSLCQYLELNNLNPRQFGFRNFKSTAYEEIALGLANNKILRDVAKAFDRVWHPGIKFRLNKQGSVLSPTLYTIYTTPILPPERNSNYVMYADDITQIITHPSPRANFINLATKRAINKINKFEGEWKIKTNINKFLVIPAARTKPGNLNLNNTNINYTKEGRLLGLKITNTGTAGHVKERRAMARKMLTKLKRFSGCPERVNLHLYKVLNFMASTTGHTKQSSAMGKRSEMATP
nr:uncharacterized protein LOC113804160 [Penaeus vannamei]